MKLSVIRPREQGGLPAWCTRLCIVITVLTVQGISETAAATRRGDDPGTIEPGRRVADMLLVATFQVRHPLLRGILMKTGDLALHGGLTGEMEAFRSTTDRAR